MPHGSSKYKEVYCNEVIECLGQGHSVTAFAGQIGVARSTVFEWMKQFPEFARAYDIAKAKAVLYWERTLLKFAGDGKGNAAAIIFALRNRAADDWVDKVVSEHTGKDGGPIETKDTSARDRLFDLVSRVSERGRADEDNKKRPH